MIDRADADDAVPGFQVPRGIPGERRHTVAELDAVFGEPLRDLERAGAHLRVIGLDDRAFDRAGDHLALAVELGGMVDDAVDQQRPILHQPEHGIPLLKSCFWAGAPRAAGAKVSRRADRRKGFVTTYGERAGLASWLSRIDAAKVAAVAAGFLAACGCGLAAAEDVPLPRPRPPVWVVPLTFRDAAGPDFNAAEVTSAPTACDQSLAKIAVFEPMPRLIGPGQCGGRDMVALDAVWLADGAHVDIKPAPVLTCAMAATFAGWLRDDVAPRMTALVSELHSVENYDDYECRPRNRAIGAKPSNHGNGIAIDVRSFTLADGRRLELTDVTVDKPLREALRESACRRFTTVLGPGSDGHHDGHIHVDMIERHNGYRICEWDVREPVQVASMLIDGKIVPLPPPRPPEAR